MECISYKKGYKYQLQQAYTLQIPLRPENNIDLDYLQLSAAGQLTIRRGYAWDGPSGPTLDTLNFMRGSLVHDALYQLMREEQLDHHRQKDPADRLLRHICRQDGMSAIRAWFVYQGVKLAGKPSTEPANRKQPVWAPRGCPG